MKESGLWEDFKRLRDDLQISEGMSARDAWRTAYERLMDGCPAPEASVGGGSRVGVNRVSSGSVGSSGVVGGEGGGNGVVRSRAISEGRVIRRSIDEREKWESLAVSAKGRKASESDQIRWVADNVLIPIEDIDEESIPCPSAVSMLMLVKSSPTTLSRWYETVWRGLLPTKAQLDAEARFADDGRELLSLIGCLEQDFQESEQEDADV